jgi:hypothetical protein
MVYVSLLNGKVIRLLLSVIVFLMFYPVVGHSAVFNVTNEDELRQSLRIAESNGEDDVINVGAGLYRTFGEPFTFETDEDFSLAIRGEGAGLTILDGDGISRVVEINSRSFSIFTLKGLTIQNGFTEDGGGGASVFGAIVEILENEFKGNTARQSFGGGFSGKGSPLYLISNKFEGNSATSGGGVWTESIEGPALIVNNIFNNNHSTFSGGGINVSAINFNAGVTFTNNTFTLNTAGRNGGAINMDVFFFDTPLLPSNSAASLKSMLYDNISISQTSSNRQSSLPFDLDIYNNIIYDNFATNEGDDIYIDDITAFSLQILTINLFNNDFSDFFSFCENSPECEPIINEGNNINKDPLFVDAEAENFSLLADSPCIDAGDPNAPDLPDTDIFGNPRVPPPDMGAVEYIEEAIKGGGGCSIAHNPVSSSLAVFLAIPFLILIRRIVKRERS